ncbi:MAG: ATP-binding protein [bacterium]|nr:ATP-binding protein [bacterium]
MRKELIKEIIVDFHRAQLPELKKRELRVPLKSEKIISIIGVRRSGKTFFLYQVMEELLKIIGRKFIVYINFEDERLDFKRDELDLILQSYRELYPGTNPEEVYFFFDEIQNVDGWDRFIRRIYDTGSKNIFVTGSNSKLLSKEISTSLRGRALSYEMFPLSFREYLEFHGVEVNLYSSKSRALILHHFDLFLRYGGFPEMQKFEDSLKDKVLQEYYNTMLFRDLIERYEIKQVHVLKYLLKRLMASLTKDFSINKIYNELKSQGLKAGKGLLYELLEGIENIYMMFVLKKYAPSIVKQELSEKKIYCVDNGLVNAVTFKFSKDTGKLIENTVAIELLRRDREVFFYREAVECDFIVKDKDMVQEAFQVSLALDNADTREREIKGLLAACKRFNLNKGWIIARDEEEEMDVSNVHIKVIPAYKFLLDK